MLDHLLLQHDETRKLEMTGSSFKYLLFRIFPYLLPNDCIISLASIRTLRLYFVTRNNLFFDSLIVDEKVLERPWGLSTMLIIYDVNCPPFLFCG